MDNFQQIDPKYLALIQAGAGILAANNGRVPAGAAIGQGLLGGAGAYQEGLQNQQMMQMRNDQIQTQKQLANARANELQAENEQRKNKSNALNAWKQQNPTLANLADIDFPTAYKAANPSMANSADPYYTAIATESGLGSFNNRTGAFEPLNIQGKPIIKSTDSPLVRGAVKGAEAEATANFKPNTLVDGSILTDSQVSNMARGLPMTATSQNMRIQPQVQRARDDKRLQILLAEQQSAGGAGMNPELDKEIANVSKQLGIKVPTKAEQASEVTTAQETAKAKVGMEIEKTKNVKTADKFLSVAQQAKELLDKDPTGSGIGAMVDRAGRLVGASSDSSQVASQLETVSGWLVSNVPRMEGPQSNFDVDNYKTMAGMIGDRTRPVEERKAALKEVMRLQEQYKSLNGAESANPPKDETVIKIKGDADYNALPSGATFIDPFGKKRIKP
jgi:hypothetical protein